MAEIRWIRKAGSGPSIQSMPRPAAQTTEVPTKDLSSMTVPELKTLADSLGVDISNRTKKAELVETIAAAVQARADAAPDDEITDGPEQPEEEKPDA